VGFHKGRCQPQRPWGAHPGLNHRLRYKSEVQPAPCVVFARSDAGRIGDVHRLGLCTGPGPAGVLANPRALRLRNPLLGAGSGFGEEFALSAASSRAASSRVISAVVPSANSTTMSVVAPAASRSTWRVDSRAQRCPRGSLGKTRTGRSGWMPAVRGGWRIGVAHGSRELSSCERVGGGRHSVPAAGEISVRSSACVRRRRGPLSREPRGSRQRPTG
jgi:hypothetical protein